MAKALDEPVSAFLNRRLDAAYPFLIVDAMFSKVRADKRVVSKALLIASGVRADGFREVLGLSIGDAESFVAWDEMFRSLKDRGLRSVDAVTSDDHRGLREATANNFVGATWQRCQVQLRYRGAARSKPAFSPWLCSTGYSLPSSGSNPIAATVTPRAGQGNPTGVRDLERGVGWVNPDFAREVFRELQIPESDLLGSSYEGLKSFLKGRVREADVQE